MQFRNDAFLWYDVPGWADQGLAVPNFGDDLTSQNGTIRYLVEVMGRNLSAVMWHQDARLRVPPSINTVTRLHKLCTRARDILAGRAVPSGQFNMESQHAVPAPESFILFPVPYFKVRNTWLKEYCGYVLLALTEAVQNTENAKGIEISLDFAGMIGQYIQRIYKLMATELLQIPVETASKSDFTLTPAQISSYNPGAYFTATEMIDTVPSPLDIPTEDDLKVLTDGIPAINLPKMGNWPTTVVANSPTSNPTNASAGNSFAPAPGV